MNRYYSFTEHIFEKLTSFATAILGNSITFILAVFLVLFWWINILCNLPDIQTFVGDIIFGVTFLSLFIIQKSFNRFSSSLHLKINEIVISNESANNAVINAEEQTEREISLLSIEYSEIEEQITTVRKKV